jgi:hypothetical protein
MPILAKCWGCRREQIDSTTRTARPEPSTPNPATTSIGVKVLGPNWRDRTGTSRGRQNCSGSCSVSASYRLPRPGCSAVKRPLARRRARHASRFGSNPIIAPTWISSNAYDAAARRPNTADVLRRSESHPGALTSIHRCASCCVTKPGMWSCLPLGHATRTYHPRADFSERASNAGFELGSFIMGASRSIWT